MWTFCWWNLCSISRRSRLLAQKAPWWYEAMHVYRWSTQPPLVLVGWWYGWAMCREGVGTPIRQWVGTAMKQSMLVKHAFCQHATWIRLACQCPKLAIYCTCHDSLKCMCSLTCMCANWNVKSENKTYFKRRHRPISLWFELSQPSSVREGCSELDPVKAANVMAVLKTCCG